MQISPGEHELELTTSEVAVDHLYRIDPYHADLAPRSP